ncbi:ammonium transporter [Blastochloris viridis]|uniref:Ammonium transporter n=1 Tax=Blastochloris viridis TaxID=1079 RepID=A0A0H5B7W4_BLAVI|nr:ammonium transporter [Blastochloris viridis]ALK08448.1 Ammonia channel precursor [Blastochloris viridis]BAR98270.1 ammonium transporter [Blastochloris viridis]CUU41110.1 Ammonia transporter [Blastochloris viridis]
MPGKVLDKLPIKSSAIGWLRGSLGAAAVLAGVLAAGPAWAGAPENSGHVAWVLTSAVLVLFMTLPGLALFYGGLLHAKNLLSIMMQCFAICCVVSLLWMAVGYSLAFDGDAALLGGFGRMFFSGFEDPYGTTYIPENVFALFQMTFAVITPALIVGAFAERVNFSFVIAFSALWLLAVYVPTAHWLWGSGWLAALGALDFAGGIVVHTTAGVSALVLAVMIGRRTGFPTGLTPPHSPGLTMMGAGMLWVGWFGFNGGSALAADASAGSAILATHTAASAGALTWIALEWMKTGKPTSIGIATGCIAGLATITPMAGYAGPAGALVVGLAAGVVCYFATLFVKHRLKIDDSLDVFAVHGCGGMMGSLLLPVFALTALGGSGVSDDRLVEMIGVQALAVAVTAVWSGLATVLIARLIGGLTPMRVGQDEEYSGLDIATHGERAYENA